MADAILRTVELGVTITDAALVGETTVVFADLLRPRGAPASRLASLVLLLLDQGQMFARALR